METYLSDTPPEQTELSLGAAFAETYRHRTPLTAAEMREAAFRKFHGANPRIYVRIRRFALEALASGKKVGMRAIWERMRWSYLVESKSDDDYKLNNNHTPHYARLLMQQEPALAGFFETRGAADG